MIKSNIPSLFIIGTPFQALCAIEAIHEFHITDYKFLLGLISTPRNEQLFSLLRQFNIEYEIVNVDYTITKLDRLLAFFPRYNKYKNIYIGDANNELYGFMAFRYGTNGATTIYLDDGVGTISYLTGERELKGSLKYYYCILKFIRNISFNKTLYTIYGDIENHNVNIIDNKFRFLASKQSQKEDCRNIIVAGATINQFYVTADRIIKNLDELFYALRKKYSSDEIIYVPHGRDTSNMWVEVCDKYQVKVVRPEVSIELYIISLPYYPKEVYGYTSSALFNIKLICPKCQVYNILFENENTPKVFSTISDYYLKHGINKLLRK